MVPNKEETLMTKLAKLLSTSALALVCAATNAAISADRLDSRELRKHVKLDRLKAHLTYFQTVASANQNNRAAATTGHGASAAYVMETLKSRGYIVTTQPFEFKVFSQLSPASFARTAPTAQTYVEDTDFTVLEYSGAGSGTAPVQAAAGLVIPPTDDPSSTSGCDAADFAGFVAGNIALIQRGGCSFATKATNAAEAGASGVIIFNEGNANDPSRIGLFGGTLGEDFGQPNLPVVGTSFETGAALAGLSGAVVTLRTDTQTETKETANVIAETRTGRADRVVVVGAHLDSVQEGPGINDNGSGSAAILEVAVQMSKRNIRPVNKVRFMWYSAEEAGLIGSQEYVDSLADTDLAKISLMLNFDMVASPNFVRFVYDGDGSDTPDAGPAGSALIEKIFANYWKSQKFPFEATAFDGRSDYGPFIDAGIPAGGLFTGAEEPKTPEQVTVYGGTAGEQLDPCYHEACDNIGNINDRVFDEMADAVAHSVYYFAMTKDRVRPPAAAEARIQARTAQRTSKLLYKGNLLQR
jgi:Zn-dependent M28 family amino/carboxypeptidase